jgi:murein DD-endopeptidase MepM/ murein hydrolase activator NlpD
MGQKPRLVRDRAWLLAIPVVLAGSLFGMRSAPPPESPPPPPPFQPLVAAEPLGPAPDFMGETLSDTIERNESLSVAAARVGMSPLEVDGIVKAMNGVFDFRHARPGHRFDLLRDGDDRLIWFRYTAGPRAIYHAYLAEDGAFTGLSEPVTVTKEVVFVSGEIEHSLYAAMDSAGETAALTMLMVDLFAWDVDFYTETQKGDRFRLLVEKEYIGGELVGYGKILGAEYAMASGRTSRAFRYLRPDGGEGYYTPDGTSVKKAFLKSPIQFASITSRYGMRRHPILSYVRAHRGVDYGAPQGTAIWAVADGVVSFAGAQGGYGNVVFIRHANGFESRYAHLSGFGKGIRSGKRVEQKDVIGYVGRTGLATGPHLHFEVLQGGRHTNPLKVAVPPSPPIHSDHMAAFRAAIAPVVTALEAGTPVLALGSPAE